MKYTYVDHIQAHEKSVVLGGARVLFPVLSSLTHQFAREIQATVKMAEESAYCQGREDAREEMRKARGL